MGTGNPEHTSSDPFHRHCHRSSSPLSRSPHRHDHIPDTPDPPNTGWLGRQERRKGSEKCRIAWFSIIALNVETRGVDLSHMIWTEVRLKLQLWRVYTSLDLWLYLDLSLWLENTKNKKIKKWIRKSVNFPSFPESANINAIHSHPVIT